MDQPESSQPEAVDADANSVVVHKVSLENGQVTVQQRGIDWKLRARQLQRVVAHLQKENPDHPILKKVTDEELATARRWSPLTEAADDELAWPASWMDSGRSFGSFYSPHFQKKTREWKRQLEASDVQQTAEREVGGSNIPVHNRENPVVDDGLGEKQVEGPTIPVTIRDSHVADDGLAVRNKDGENLSKGDEYRNCVGKMHDMINSFKNRGGGGGNSNGQGINRNDNAPNMVTGSQDDAGQRIPGAFLDFHGTEAGPALASPTPSQIHLNFARTEAAGRTRSEDLVVSLILRFKDEDADREAGEGVEQLRRRVQKNWRI